MKEKEVQKLNSTDESIKSHSTVQMESVFNSIPEMIFIVNKDFEILDMNVAAHRGLKLRENIIGASIEGFIHQKDITKLIQEEKSFKGEIDFVTRDLSLLPSIMTAELLDHSVRNDEEQYVITSLDLREFKKREEKLIKAREQAEALTKVKTDFLSVMSHEIRTPLNAVIGLAEILLNEKPRQDQLEKLEILKFSADNLTTLINDILDYSKIEAGKVELEKAPLNLNEVLLNIRESLKFLAEENQNNFVLNCPKTLPLVYGDRVRLVQILTNIVGNSVKFTKQGEVVLSVLEISRTDYEVIISFSIMDTGCGIPEDKLNTVFEEFSQAETGTTRKYGGTGLGLTITKNLIDLHNSEITVRSQVGVGTNFYFDICFDLCDETIELESNEAGLSKLEKKKILLAEDNPVNVMVASNFLDQLNIKYDIASNGLEAVEMASKNQYDLILMDIQMPKLDGLEAAQELKLKGVNVPVIALTASALVEDKEKAFEVGMVDFISKPFKSEELNRKLIQYT